MVDYDIAVIGGGIQGAGCAQAGAAAGYSVCLIEKDTWGAATSGHSTKLIHGGLRYLETGQLGLIRKALRERRILLEIAASLVRPIPFYIPVYEDSRHRPWMIAAGLTVYRLLGGRTPLTRFGRVPKDAWPLATGLRSEGLLKIYRYWEAQTDDRLLTRAVARSAGELGASLHEHALFLGARWEADRNRYLLSYRQNRKEAEIGCRVLINAGGPWAGKVQAAIATAPTPPPIELVQGAHLVLPGRISEAAFYVESPDDRRPVFILPWHENTLVGSTETPFSGDPDQCRATGAEIDYLTAAVRHYFPARTGDPLASFAGLRVLPHSRSDFNDRPRDTMIRYDNPARPRLVGLYGGKLTTYRATSEKVIKQLAKTLGGRGGKLDTALIPLAGEGSEEIFGGRK